VEPCGKQHTKGGVVFEKFTHPHTWTLKPFLLKKLTKKILNFSNARGADLGAALMDA
jgi:hypothetical protein